MSPDSPARRAGRTHEPDSRTGDVRAIGRHCRGQLAALSSSAGVHRTGEPRARRGTAAERVDKSTDMDTPPLAAGPAPGRLRRTAEVSKVIDSTVQAVSPAAGTAPGPDGLMTYGAPRQRPGKVGRAERGPGQQTERSTTRAARPGPSGHPASAAAALAGQPPAQHPPPGSARSQGNRRVRVVMLPAQAKHVAMVESSESSHRGPESSTVVVCTPAPASSQTRTA